MKRLAWAVLVGVGGCGSEPSPFVQGDASGVQDTAEEVSDGAVEDAPGDRPVVPVRDTGPGLDQTVVYAHSDTVLYSVDPRSLAVRMVGTFSFLPGDMNQHGMTDLAVDAEGRITGVTRDALYRIDDRTARCTLITALDRALTGSDAFVGLTYLPAGTLDPVNEALVGGTTGTSGGTLWRIDPATGRSTMLGRLRAGGMSYNLSGDLVSVLGAGTYVTLRRLNATSTDSDLLATVDVRTGELRVLGATGFDRIFGLAYWRATLYGFTREGEFLTLDARTGRGMRASMPAMQFSGAGVTTLAPTAPP
ncbi:MAG: hypothetical protein HY909_01410 [Deltaproteobacteria bacterium]|nr:hypothetical protein [Deltaproteobacteria bacterium]